MGIDVQRRAQNQVTFRRANEDIAKARERLEVDGATPYVCECDDERCREIVRLSPAEYERVRSDAACFVILPGHDQTAHEVVVDTGTYVIVAKLGEAREVAEAADPRRETR